MNDTAPGVAVDDTLAETADVFDTEDAILFMPPATRPAATDLSDSTLVRNRSSASPWSLTVACRFWIVTSGLRSIDISWLTSVATSMPPAVTPIADEADIVISFRRGPVL